VSSANERSLGTDAQIPADERRVRFETLLGSPQKPFTDEAEIVVLRVLLLPQYGLPNGLFVD